VALCVGLPRAAPTPLHEGHRYERHRPEQTVLYRVVTTHWAAFRERVEEVGPLPRFVVNEVEAYLRCGILEFGHVRVACETCGFERLVAFSCKRRGFCPSCLGRRMSDTAVHLTEQVLPQVPIRQWVCSLPWGLRALVGYDRELCAEVAGAFVQELLRSLRFRAKRLFGLESARDAHPGAVTFLQRFDSALRLNVHFHTLALDGVYVRRGDAATGELVFRALPEPTDEDVLDVAQRTAQRVVTILSKHGRSLEGLGDEAERATERDPALASCVGAAARTPALRVVDRSRTRDNERVAVVMGFDVHAGAAIDGRDRPRVERLCRYLGRPPVAQDRLERLADGKVRYEMKKPWRDGTRFVIFEPDDLMARLCAMVPPPWFHMIRFHGVLAPNATLREQVVTSARLSAGAASPKPPAAPAFVEQLSLFGGSAKPDDTGVPSGRRPWAWLLRHVFSVDVTVCPKCSGPMRWLAVATTPEDIADSLARAGLGARAPRHARWLERHPSQ
jgi:hypothetical protein